MNYLSLHILTLKQTDFCVYASLKMGTGNGGERSLPCIVFQIVACMKIVYINCIWIGCGFGILFRICSFSW